MGPTPRPKPPMLRVVRAAGAVMWRLREGGQTLPGTTTPATPADIEVLVVHRPRYNDWSWPKGKIEPGESLLTCATREVEEETSLVTQLGARLTTQRYRLGAGHTKEVHYWVGRVDMFPGAVRARRPVKLASAREIDETRWVRPAKALRLLNRRGDRRLLDEVITRLQGGTLDTATVIVLRHAKAVTRQNWTDGEATRPLARAGIAQVHNLTPLLSAYGVGRVITSPWRRCLTTVAPYASLTGAQLQVEGALTEDAADSPALAQIMGRELALPGREPVLMCVHRPTLPQILAPLADATPLHLGRALPEEDPYLKTAEMLVAHVARAHHGADNRPRVIDIERHRAAV